jgi:hypothetical protein
VNVQPEVLQQLATLIPVGLAIHPDVVNRFGEQGGRALDFHRPSSLVSDSDVVLSTTAHGTSWVFALDGDFTIAGIEVHLGDFGVFRQDGLDVSPRFVHVHHGIEGRSQHNLPLDALADFPNQSVLTRKGTDITGDDRNVPCFKIEFVFN